MEKKKFSSDSVERMNEVIPLAQHLLPLSYQIVTETSFPIPRLEFYSPLVLPSIGSTDFESQQAGNTLGFGIASDWLL